MIVLAMILSAGITTHSPVSGLTYLNQNQIAFQDITALTRICELGQFGVYTRPEIAFQIKTCSTDTFFKAGFEAGEINKPQ